MAQTVDVDGNPVETVSETEAAAELLGEESTSPPEPDDAEESADPPEEASAAEGDEELSAEELEELAEETTGDTSAKGLKELKSFIDKTYNGDVDAFFKGWHENNKNMKEVRQELSDLREAIQAGKFNAEAEAEDIPENFEVAADADVTFHSENIESLEQEIQQAQQAAQYYMSEAGKAGLKLERLQGKMENADDSEIPAIKAEISSIEAKMNGLLKDSNISDKEFKALNKQLKIEQRSLKQAERQAEKERSEFRKQHQAQRETAQKIRKDASSDFSSTAASLMEKYGIPEAVQPQQIEVLRAMVSNQLRSLGPNAPIQDIKAMTEALGKAHFESLDAITRAKFGKTAKTKTSTQRAAKRTPKPSASPSAQTSKPRSQWSQRDYDDHAAKVARYYDSL